MGQQAEELEALIERWRAEAKKDGEVAFQAYHDHLHEKAAEFQGRTDVWYEAADQLEKAWEQEHGATG